MPSIVIVALGEPGVPLICWAFAQGVRIVPRRILNESAVAILIIPPLLTIAASIQDHLLPIARSGPQPNARDD